MSFLRVESGGQRMELLHPGERLELDRQYVTNGDTDTSVSRKGNAALLRHLDGAWYVFNQSSQRSLRLVEVERGRPHLIAPLGSVRLVAEYCELYVGGTHRIGLVVEAPAEPTRDAPGILTKIPEVKLVEEVLGLFGRKPKHKIVTFVRFRSYIVEGRLPDAEPRPLTANEVVECFRASEGFAPVNLTQVNQIQRDLTVINKLDVAKTGPWLVDHGILTAAALIGLPKPGDDGATRHR